jgi:hypothetical protein
VDDDFPESGPVAWFESDSEVGSDAGLDSVEEGCWLDVLEDVEARLVDDVVGATLLDVDSGKAVSICYEAEQDEIRRHTSA